MVTFPAGVTGSNEINEVFRDALRLDTSFTDFWNILPPIVENPIVLTFESRMNRPEFIRLDSVTPATSGILPGHVVFTSTQRGAETTTNPVYPMVTLESPIGDPTPAQQIELTPPPGSRLRLDNNDIASAIRSGFSASGWSVVSGIDSNIGAAPADNQIRIVRDTEGEVNSGTEQTMGWRITNITYGNTGVTLPGSAESMDGNALGRLNIPDFSRADSQGRVTTTNPLITAVGMGDNLDFRGSVTERSQPTRVMIGITNPDINSIDPVIDIGTNMYRDAANTVNVTAGNTQYIALTFGERGTYDQTDQSGSQPGTRRNAEYIINAMQSAITTSNRRVQVMRPGLTELTVIPSQFSGLANFVVEVFTNDTADNVARWNSIIENNSSTQTNLAGLTINTDNNNGIQSTVPANVRSLSNAQFSPGNRIPNFTSRNVVTTGLITQTSTINREFDPLRPWPTAQVNLNQEYPVFVTAVLDSNTGLLTQNFRGADLGFIFLDTQYESFVERIELALTPEFDTEQLQSLALWADGGSRINFTQPTEQATLDVKLYGTNSPGETLGLFDNTPFTRNEETNRLTTNTMMQRTVDNEFKIGQDYKIDMRVHGRFINILISDYQTTSDGS